MPSHLGPGAGAGQPKISPVQSFYSDVQQKLALLKKYKEETSKQAVRETEQRLAFQSYIRSCERKLSTWHMRFAYGLLISEIYVEKELFPLGKRKIIELVNWLKKFKGGSFDSLKLSDLMVVAIVFGRPIIQDWSPFPELISFQIKLTQALNKKLAAEKNAETANYCREKLRASFPHFGHFDAHLFQLIKQFGLNPIKKIFTSKAMQSELEQLTGSEKKRVDFILAALGGVPKDSTKEEWRKKLFHDLVCLYAKGHITSKERLMDYFKKFVKPMYNYWDHFSSTESAEVEIFLKEQVGWSEYQGKIFAKPLLAESKEAEPYQLLLEYLLFGKGYKNFFYVLDAFLAKETSFKKICQLNLFAINSVMVVSDNPNRLRVIKPLVKQFKERLASFDFKRVLLEPGAIFPFLQAIWQLRRFNTQLRLAVEEVSFQWNLEDLLIEPAALLKQFSRALRDHCNGEDPVLTQSVKNVFIRLYIDTYDCVASHCTCFNFFKHCLTHEQTVWLKALDLLHPDVDPLEWIKSNNLTEQLLAMRNSLAVDYLLLDNKVHLSDRERISTELLKNNRISDNKLKSRLVLIKLACKVKLADLTTFKDQIHHLIKQDAIEQPWLDLFFSFLTNRIDKALTISALRTTVPTGLAVVKRAISKQKQFLSARLREFKIRQDAANRTNQQTVVQGTVIAEPLSKEDPIVAGQAVEIVEAEIPAVVGQTVEIVETERPVALGQLVEVVQAEHLTETERKSVPYKAVSAEIIRKLNAVPAVPLDEPEPEIISRPNQVPAVPNLTKQSNEIPLNSVTNQVATEVLDPEEPPSLVPTPA